MEIISHVHNMSSVGPAHLSTCTPPLTHLHPHLLPSPTFPSPHPLYNSLSFTHTLSIPHYSPPSPHLSPTTPHLFPHPISPHNHLFPNSHLSPTPTSPYPNSTSPKSHFFPTTTTTFPTSPPPISKILDLPLGM